MALAQRLGLCSRQVLSHLRWINGNLASTLEIIADRDIRWLAKRPRWHVHLTPTSSSWLNQVERFFALLTDKKIRRGVYRSVAALRADIASFIERHNADPKPFRWTKSADDILASIERFCRYNAPAKHDATLRTSGSGH